MRERWPSLRVRVAALTASVACAAVAAMGLYSAHVAPAALRTQLRPLGSSRLRAIAADASRALATPSPLAGVQRVLDQASDEVGKGFVVVDVSQRVLVAAPRELLRRGLRADADGTIVWEIAEANARVVRRARVVSDAPDASSAWIVSPRGDTLARLLELPPQVVLEAAGTALAPGALRRTLALGVVIGLIGALLATVVLSAHVVAPIERLTRAVRAVRAAGARDHRTGEPTRVASEVGGSGEVAELGRAFDTMLAELDRHERLRRATTSDIAHELRTPVTNLRCHIESLEDGLETFGPATLASLHEEIMVLQHLIEDLQDLALADDGGLRLERVPLDLSHELELAVRPFRARAATASVRLTLSALDSLPPIEADPVRLRQIVSNLVANALAHTPPGGHVDVRVRNATDDATDSAIGRAAVDIEVADTGIGIAPEDLPNVFERFYRVDRSRSRGRGGAGLGLAIVERLVTLHGGTVSIASTPGAGTTVRVRLPASDTRAHGAAATDAPVIDAGVTSIA